MLKYLDDLLFLAGCVCIEIGLAQWSIPLTWITGGVMLIIFSFLIARKMANVSK